MIVYNVQCSKGHVWEEWFASSTDFEAKAEAHEITCPECADKDVKRAIMAPNVARKGAGAVSAPAAPAGGCGMGGCGSGMCGLNF